MTNEIKPHTTPDLTSQLSILTDKMRYNATCMDFYANKSIDVLYEDSIIYYAGKLSSLAGDIEDLIYYMEKGYNNAKSK